MSVFQERGLINSHIDNFGRITKKDVMDLCKCGQDHAYYLLRKMVENDELLALGKGKATFYVRKHD